MEIDNDLLMSAPGMGHGAWGMLDALFFIFVFDLLYYLCIIDELSGIWIYKR